VAVEDRTIRELTDTAPPTQCNPATRPRFVRALSGTPCVRITTVSAGSVSIA
jgi:hypothetical protein